MFPAFTKIAMADKTARNIKDVKQGDRVLSAAGRDMPVADVLWESYDSDVIRVDYQDEGTVYATPGQLFLTDRGPVLASALVVGDRLQTPFYGEEDRSVYWDVDATRHVFYAGDVCALVIACDGSYVADGVSVVHGYMV